MKKKCLLLVVVMTLLCMNAFAESTEMSEFGSMHGSDSADMSEEDWQEHLLKEAQEDRRKKLRDEYVPKIKDYDQNTVCSFGPQFRDVSPRMTDEWYMFTPVDLSQDGKQTFDLIAGNMYEIGTVTVTVKDGKFQVDYSYNDSKILIGREYFTIFPDYDSITEKDLTQLKKRFDYGRAYDIDIKLDGDTDVILFVCNTATFQKTTRGVTAYYKNHPDCVPVREKLLEMIGKEIVNTDK